MSPHSLIRGTIALTIAAVITRVIGFGNRMLLSRLIGAEGLGIFQMMIPIYTLTAVVANLGLPGAVVKAIGERHARNDFCGIEQVRFITLRVVFISACCAALFLFYFSFSPLSEVFPDHRIILPMRIMPFALFCAAITAALKSFFQGQGNMLPTAVSQIGEQIARVGFGLIGILFFISLGLEYAILGIMIGVAMGELVGLNIVLYFDYHYRKLKVNTFPKKKPYFSRQVTGELFSLAIPLVIIRLSSSLVHMTEAFLIPLRLQDAGFCVAEATILFGQFSGMALPLLFLPTVAIIPLNIAIIPSIAGAVSLKEKSRLKRLLQFSLLTTLSIGLITGVILYVFNFQLATFIYRDPTAAPLIKQIATAAPFIYLQFTTASILHGMGRPGIALICDLIGMGTCLVIIYIFTADPAYGIEGTIWGYIIGFAVTAALGLYFVYKLYTYLNR